jgi:hypothetical protein
MVFYPIIPALGTKRHKDLKFKVSLSYITGPCIKKKKVLDGN